jgi:hypothetical protein
VHVRTHVKQVVTGSGAEAVIAKQSSINATLAIKRFMAGFSFFLEVSISATFFRRLETWQRVLSHPHF